MRLDSKRLSDASALAAALEQYAVEYRQNIDAPYFLRARKVVVDYFLKRLPDGSKILDINCGTGIDVVEMAQRGHTVKGIDISSAMIGFAKSSVLAHDLVGRAEVEVRDYSCLPNFDAQFNAALSNFGGINFTEDLDRVFESVGKNLSAGGLFLINSVSRFSLIEFAAFALKGKIEKAFRRLTGGTAHIGGREVRLYYHARKAFIESASRHGFKMVDSFGLNILVPPLWADNFFRNHPRLTLLLERVDNTIRHVPALRSMGDFTVVVLMKTGG